MSEQPLWQPSPDRIASATVTRFMAELEAKNGAKTGDFPALWRWSVDNSPEFWDLVWDFCGVIGEKGSRILIDADKMPGAQFFPDAKLNYAENLLRKNDDSDAIVFWGEDKVKRRLSWRDLNEAVSRLAQALKGEGVGRGDRVAAYMPNLPETVIAMLATSSLGATFTSASPDFGVQGVLDRFGQTEPTVLIAVEGYHYNGKVIDCLTKLREVAAQLPTVKRVVVVPYARDAMDLSGIERAVAYADFVAPHQPKPLEFVRVPFNHPLYILYSSGTTGVPKCIMHGVGGTLIQHLKELQLHSDVKPGDRVFYFTTCGWMMWNWLVSALACEATLLLYDGSPFYPDARILFDYADAEGMTLFGTSAKYIDAVLKSGLKPRETHSLKTVRAMTSTGSPLSPEGFDFVYAGIKPDICLSSISGGTDIVSCFVLGNPIGPVWRGEIQARGLGMAVDVFNDEGKPVREQKGELVCTQPFPCMPIAFWNDPDGAKYRAAYFENFPNIWCHGDFVELTKHDGMIIYGRSDATLNPGGVRIGTAEIYRQVEKLPEVLEAIVIGQDWDSDVRVVLFVKLRDEVTLDEELEKRIRQQIRSGATPRHVPAKIVQVGDIPRTKSGKIVELAVRNIVHGRPIKNIEALANPEALDLYRDRNELTD
ncbi:MAG: acetoacetate--CoA ligase [Alphaproteobacteria bacterium]|nr:acetoacetate--CoA ligase [Alphaproteobacteria bacterium]MBU0797211.1 acetoacetate--CoA ligase [Alphaproteobacteria bacterium]MBU0889001.1 acetoacetate--CoA ligase [Alphaproteobacteria bacterium]MBU1814021.1 acetoacetate--CoA ligase [Alphaproteobacteria bacterium]